MSVRVDPRIAARRQEVAEHGARSRLRAMVVLAVLLAGSGLAVWATQSPLLDVDIIRIEGAERTQAGAILEGRSITEGVPIVAAIWRARSAERELEADPWVRDASVSVIVPDAVEVVVIEREALAWARSEEGWALLAADGTVLERHAEAGDELPRLVSIVPEAPGATVTDAVVVGGLEFVAALPARLRVGVAVSAESDGVWALVADHRVKLGRPIDMAAKAVAVAAVIDDVPDGWSLNVVAPTRPASWDPAAAPAGDDEIDGGAEATEEGSLTDE